MLGRKTAVAINKDGSLLRRETYAYDSAGNLLQIANSLGQTITYTYDAKNRRASVTDITGATVTYQHNVLGRVGTVTDASLSTTQYLYDDLNRLITVQDVAGNQTSYGYNAAGLVTSITNARGQVTRLGYDLAGQCRWRQEPLGQTHQYHYDERGRLSYLIDPDSQRIDYTYNALNKVEEIRFDTGTPRTLAFTYDDGGNLLTFSDDAIAGTPVYTYTYDNLSRIDTVTHHLINKTLDYDYGHLGYRQKLTCRSGIDELFHYFYQYDDAGLLTTIHEMPLDKTIAFSHDDAGRLLTKTYSGNVTATRTYKPNGLLDQIVYRRTNGTPVESLTFGYDDLGLLTTISDSQGSASFTYDPLYRLGTAVYSGTTGQVNESYTYDATGNRLTSTATSDWTYDGNNRLTAYGGISFTHDPRGNQASQTSGGSTTTYTHDPLNRLTGLNTTGISSAYTYDHRSRRIKKTVNASTTWYLYDGNRLLAEFDAAGDLARHYLHNPRGPEPLSISQDGNSYPILTNHIGAPLHVLNADQDPVWSARYQTFGKALLNEDPDGNSVSFTCNLRFPGQYHDQESELYYNIARYYDPAQGRYLQPDPLGGTLYAPAGLNRYPYALNNPLYNIDPDGRLVACTAVGLTLAILAIVTIYQVGSTASSGPGLIQDAKDFLDIQGAIDEGGRSLDEVMARSRRVVLGIFNSLFTRGHSDALEYMEGLAESDDDAYVDPFSRSGLSWSQWWDLNVVHNFEWATGTGWYEYEDNLPRRINNALNRAADWTNRRLSEAHAWSVRTYHEYRPVVEQHVSNAWQRVRQGVNYLGARAATLWGQIRNYFSGK
jgi:RHS repeat-associated protein